MKIWIEKANADMTKIGGKALFQARLAHELRRTGHEVVDSGDADVSLNVIGIKHAKSKVKVLRLNGVWHDTGKDWKAKNAGIKESLQKADAVVYQSQFSRQMCDEYLGESKVPWRVIFNGADPRVFDSVKPAEVDCKHLFLAISKWRPHKRLRDIIESFTLADIQDSKLFVLGDVKRSGLSATEVQQYFKRPDIEYLGNVPQTVLMPLLRAATASIHICWFDACPNSVVEAICAGCPVICNNTGGTRELVGQAGFEGEIVEVDKVYDFKPVDLYHPPKIDRRLIAEAMALQAARQLDYRAGQRKTLYQSHVDIRNIAQQYLMFFKELL